MVDNGSEICCPAIFKMQFETKFKEHFLLLRSLSGSSRQKTKKYFYKGGVNHWNGY